MVTFLSVQWCKCCLHAKYYIILYFIVHKISGKFHCFGEKFSDIFWLVCRIEQNTCKSLYVNFKGKHEENKKIVLGLFISILGNKIASPTG